MPVDLTELPHEPSIESDSIERTAAKVFKLRSDEMERLDRLHGYMSGTQELAFIDKGVPEEVRRIAKMSRVNVLRFVIDAKVQSLFVDGYRSTSQAPADADDDAPITAETAAWEVWQRNRMDARQLGVHRAGCGYGASYVSVLPGDPVPVLTPHSPRSLTAVYDADDDEWPAWALERRGIAWVGSQKRSLWRLWDSRFVHHLNSHAEVPSRFSYTGLSEEHGSGVTPIVRYLATHDLDDQVVSDVEGLIPLQDQINLTTFALLVAQHFGAFRQRWIVGWLADTEEKKLKAAASKLWTFEGEPEGVKVGEFSQTDLKGYIESREATLRHLATISQTPAHELLGQLVNLSAEALSAAEAGHRRNITERQISFGEGHEQLLGFVASMLGHTPDPSASVWWLDTEARSMAQMADALGKLVTMLGVPPRELWHRIPGVNQDDVERFKAAADATDAFSGLAALLERQAGEEAA